MAPVRELRRLFEAISRKDWEAAQSAGEKLATLEAQRGNQLAARALRDSLRHKNGSSPHQASVLDLALSRRTSEVRLSEVVLPPGLRRELSMVLDEFRHADELKAKGFDVRRKLIFTGPPGCGKSLTAQALANELGLSHFVIRFDAIIGSYLGQTASQLRQLFRFAEERPSVLLFDEIDALGKTRGNPSEIGELDRIVIALMQELELSSPKGLIIATSNIPEHLDRALWRRFNAQYHFPAPKKQELRSFVRGIEQKFKRHVPVPVVTSAIGRRSYAEAEIVVSDCLRQQVLSELNKTNARRA